MKRASKANGDAKSNKNSSQASESFMREDLSVDGNKGCSSKSTGDGGIICQLLAFLWHIISIFTGLVLLESLCFCNLPFVILAISYGINAGCYYALGTLLYCFITAYLEDADQIAGQIGLTLVLAGVLGAVVVGFWLDRTKTFKQTTIGIYVCTFLCLAAFTGFLELRLVWLMFVIAFLLGLFMTGYLPVGFEFAVEITYPEPEGSSSGILNAAAQVFGIVLTISERALFQYDPRYGTLYANALGCVTLIVGIVLTVLVKADLRRQRALGVQESADAAPTPGVAIALLDSSNGRVDEKPVFAVDA